jgi:hypothetical protein
MLTVTSSVSLQPLASVTVTVYVVVANGFTVIEAVEAPVFQEYVPPPVADKVVLSPEHIVTSGPALTVGSRFTVTVTSSVSSQPLLSIAVTVYVVVDVGEIVMVEELSPVFHR